MIKFMMLVGVSHSRATVVHAVPRALPHCATFFGGVARRDTVDATACHRKFAVGLTPFNRVFGWRVGKARVDAVALEGGQSLIVV